MRKKAERTCKERIKRAAVPAIKIMGVLCLAVVCGYCFCLALNADCFRLKTFAVSGCSVFTEEDIIAKSGLRFGTSLFLLDLKKASSELEKDPWMCSAIIRRTFPDRVEITVKEHKPVACLMLDESYLVDTEGCIFCKAPCEYMRLPHIEGLNRELFASDSKRAGDLLYDACRLVEALRGIGVLLGSGSIVRADPAMGLSISGVPNYGDIQFGFDHFEHKVKCLEKIIKDMRKKNLYAQTIQLQSQYTAYVQPALPAGDAHTSAGHLL